ncbi:Integral membrane protein TerC family protein [Methyloligella halotolerans]|uniref:Integral membrane protein TerC family protein n=1 Tax=Methyloligella halotolerans TaxID=1177755 RepID=A0A1E2S2E7_9HYPH|nr:TerC family protein [Methyloligella halotolerans]ODA68611.1 Integral membrane protein TerC family protein [Methyloligella halotolerans]
MSFDDPSFLIAVLQIIWIDLLLSGDNAVVIALACRNLPPRQRLTGLVLGTIVAITMRIAFAGVITKLMMVPYLKIAGGVLLIWIAVKLLVQDSCDEDCRVETGETLGRAIRIIAVADIVMSLDNVIAIAAAARGTLSLLIFGLLVSIPLIMAGAALVLATVERFPIVIWAGAALLGWIAGEIIITDPFIASLMAKGHYPYAWLFAGLAGIALVLSAGYMWRRRCQQRERPDYI